MDDPRYQKVKELFFAASELPTGEREGFLARLEDDERELADEVRSLVRCWREEPGFLDRPAGDDDSETPNAAGSELDPRRLLAGWERYSLGERLGAGGMSVVYRATDRRTGRPVAIKLLTRLGDSALARFRREADALRRVDHELVLDLYEAGTVAGIPFLAMKLVEGPAFLEVRRHTSLAQQAELVRDVARGLHAAHQAGFLHRDVKPSNILVERRPDAGFRPYLADFGIARDPEDAAVTATGALLGTPSYLAPERLVGESGHLDRRSDVYALGVTFYELVVGRRPYGSASSPASTLEILCHIRDGEVALPRDVVPGLPAALEAILMKCLAAEPARRYATAAALAEDLDRFLAGRPVEAPILGRITRAWRRARRSYRRGVARAAASAAALTVLLGSLLARGA